MTETVSPQNLQGVQPVQTGFGGIMPNQQGNAQNVKFIQADVTIDIGNSGSRVYVETSTHRYYFEMSNRFTHIPDTTQVHQKYLDNRSTFIQTNNGVYANGYIVDMEYQNDLIRPVSYQQKVEQEVTYLTLKTALARAVKILSEYYSIPVQELNVSFNLNVLLPPLRARVDGDLLKSRTEELSQITMVSPLQFSKKVALTIDIKAEGVSAFFSAFFKEEGVIAHQDNDKVNFSLGQYEIYDLTKAQMVVVQENAEFHNGELLVIDIGAGTGDAVVFRDMELVEGSRETFNRGGNSVESTIKNLIKQELNFTPPASDMQSILATGYAKEGTTTHDVAHIVQQARDAYAKAFKSDLEEYFEGQLIQPRLIKGLLVVGGGALDTKVNGEVRATSMVDSILKYMREIAPNMKRVHTEGNLRRLNAYGAVLQSRYAK